MKIAVIGTGYVGLVTGTCFAETGNHVVCVDIDKDKVERLKMARFPFTNHILIQYLNETSVRVDYNLRRVLKRGSKMLR